MTRIHRLTKRSVRLLGVAISAAVSIQLSLPGGALATSTNATASAPSAPITNAQALADALNVNAPTGTPYATVYEVRVLTTQYGWRDEGVKFYGSTDTTHPVYRLWNSLQTADGGLGSHLWTPEFNEYVTLPQLPPVGAWRQEGVAWYAVGLSD